MLTRLPEQSRRFPLARVLRIIGGTLLVASASTFLLQRWQAGSDLFRYALLVVHTLLVAAAAWFCGLGVRESRGARTFLGLVLAIIPVDFGVLAGLVYSQFRWEDAVVLPRYAVWQAPSAVAALGTFGLTCLLLWPLALLSLVALARAEARRLTAWFVVTNLCLVLPVRDPHVTALVASAAGLGLMAFETWVWTKEPTLRTFEGRVARLVLWIPLAVMVGRSITLYRPSCLFAGVVSLSGCIAWFMGTRRVDAAPVRNWSTWLSALGALGGWLLCWSYFATHHRLPDAWQIPLFCGPAAALLIGFSWWAGGAGRALRVLAAGFACLCAGPNLLLYPSFGMSLACLLVGIALVAWGVGGEQKLPLVGGVLTALFGLGYHLRYAIELDSVARWGSLSLLGLGLIVAASYLERHQERLGAWMRKARAAFGQWEY